MTFLYHLAIHCYVLAIRIAAIFNPKARQWIRGRRGIFNELIQKLSGERLANSRCVWVHAASLGEFEQGRPIIEQIKQKYPDTKIILTFFSPSGYEIRKDYGGADFVFYLPADTPRNARRFLDIVQPDLAIFIKYEFWYNYLNTLKLRHTPTLLVSAIFREKQIFFRPYGQFFKRMLTCFEHVFVQDNFSLELLQKNNLTHASVAGDTRMDSVYQLSQNPKQFPLIEAFKGENDLLVCGSTWREDEVWLLDFLNKTQSSPPPTAKGGDFSLRERLSASLSPPLEGAGGRTVQKTIIAPHDISESHIQYILSNLKIKAVRYSQANLETIQEAEVLIIDNIGMLSSIYQYGKWAYIGGGFGASIHNTQEAFVYGLPVVFGPKYHKFKEAVDLLAEGGGFVVHSRAEFGTVFEKLQDENTYKTASKICLDYVNQNKGATAKIMSYIHPYFIDA